jgi:[protein-PII] uridylyltransferase
MARGVLERLGFSAEDVSAACQLILRHLDLYQIAARRDREDPETVSDFARLVHGREELRHLFLLTVADLSTTSPTSMTTWKRHMLDELFVVTDRALERTSCCAERSPSSHHAAILELWGPGDDLEFLVEYVDSMPENYLVSNTPQAIALHARVALRGRGRVVTVEVVPSDRPDVVELCIVSGDRPNDSLRPVHGDRPRFLASIAAAITSNGFDVHAAQIHTRRLPDRPVQAVDVVWVTPRGRAVDDLDGALQKLGHDLENLVNGVVSPKDLLRTWRGGRFSDRPVPTVVTEVNVDNRASASHTVIEIVTRDRPGLLFTIAEQFQDLKLTISVAKINTEGTRVLDVFYVTDYQHKKLEDPVRRDQVQRRLFAALNGARVTRPPVALAAL